MLEGQEGNRSLSLDLGGFVKCDLVQAMETAKTTGTNIKLFLSFESFCGCS